MQFTTVPQRHPVLVERRRSSAPASYYFYYKLRVKSLLLLSHRIYKSSACRTLFLLYALSIYNMFFSPQGIPSHCLVVQQVQLLAIAHPLGIHPSIRVVNRAPWSVWCRHARARFVAGTRRCISRIRRRGHRWPSASDGSAGRRSIRAPILGKCEALMHS